MARTSAISAGILELSDADHLAVDAPREVARARRARRRCRRTCRPRSCARRAEHDDPAAGHVFAAVIAHGLDDGVDAAVADAEALARHAADVGLAAGGPVEGDVADDDVLLRDERAARRRIDDDLAAGQPLAEVVVGVALEA